MDNNSNMLQLCRLCLVKDDVNIPIFEEQGDIRQIFLKISSCLPVKVSRDDQLPKKICDGCSYKLDMLYEFWNTSANAEKQLLTWLGEAGMTSQMADGTISAVAQQIKPADTFVKQETIDPPDIHSDDDDKDYVYKEKQQEEKSKNNVDEPPPKRARRTAAVKAAIAMDQDSDDDDSGEPMTKIEDDSDDSDNDDDHEPAFVDVPSTSADDQPGPSGVGKDGVEAPFSINKPNQVNFIIPNFNTPISVQGLSNPSGPVYLFIQPKTTSLVRKPVQEMPILNRPSIPNVPPLVRFQMPTIRYVQIGTNNEKDEEDKKEKEEREKKGKEKEEEEYQNPFDYNIQNPYINTYYKSIKEKEHKADKLKSVKQKLNKKDSITLHCIICFAKYEDKTALIDHYEMHKNVQDQIENNINDKEYRIFCPVCNINFKTRATYGFHVLQKHAPKEYTCSHCDRTFSNEFYLSVHLAVHEPDPTTYVCKVCKEFSTKETSILWDHIIKNHIKEVYSCKDCRKNFTSETWFNDHKIFHIKESQFMCNKCHLQLPSQRQYIAHMKKSHGITIDFNVKNKCFECNATFPFGRNLERHKLLVHTNPNTFLCSICGKGFPYNQSLKLHMKVHGEKQYTCSTCGKSFKHMRLLTLHNRIHTGEKPNKCKECGKCFTQKSTLNVHLRTHSGERPYPCEKCKKGFITKTIRDNHQKSCKK